MFIFTCLILHSRLFLLMNIYVYIFMRKKCVDPTAVSFVEVIIFLIIFKEQAKQTLIVEDVFSLHIQ